MYFKELFLRDMNERVTYTYSMNVKHLGMFVSPEGDKRIFKRYPFICQTKSVRTVTTEQTHVHRVPTEQTYVHTVPTKWTHVHIEPTK